MLAICISNIDDGIGLEVVQPFYIPIKVEKASIIQIRCIVLSMKMKCIFEEDGRGIEPII